MTTGDVVPGGMVCWVEPAVPFTVLPVEFTDSHAISVSADLRGRDRLDQKAWPAFFSYEGDSPYLVVLVKEG